MPSKVIFNGNILNENEVNISINNRSFRYGDGCFETIKVVGGKILLADLHFARLFSSLEKLQFAVPADLNANSVRELIVKLVDCNEHSSLARVRVTMFRGDGGVYDDVNHEPEFLIQSWKAPETVNHFNQDGSSLDIFYEAKKTSDHFSSIKSNNYLPYIMGALYAKKHGFDDCLMLNCFDRIAESTIANVFIVKDGVIKTPALSEGCVAGVMRKCLISSFKQDNIPFVEGEIDSEELLAASEVFLTNAMVGIKWVSKVGKSNYSNQMSAFLHQRYILPLFQSTTL